MYNQYIIYYDINNIKIIKILVSKLKDGIICYTLNQIIYNNKFTIINLLLLINYIKYYFL